MTWVRIDDDFADHPKVAPLSDAAFRLHVTAMCYCGRLLTDGVVPRGMIQRLCIHPDPSVLVDELVSAGCWELAGSSYVIHDFLVYNPTAEQVKREREGNRRRQTDFRTRHKDENNAVTNTITNAVNNGPVTGAPYPTPITSVDKSTEGKPPRKSRQKGVDLGPLFLAFTQAGKDRPIIETHTEKDGAQFLVKNFGSNVSDIPDCWDDIAHGRWGSDHERRRLSFRLLASDNLFQNWLRWKDEGKPAGPSRASPNNGRTDRPGPDLPNVTGQPLPWEVAT